MCAHINVSKNLACIHKTQTYTHSEPKPLICISGRILGKEIRKRISNTEKELLVLLLMCGKVTAQHIRTKYVLHTIAFQNVIEIHSTARNILHWLPLSSATTIAATVCQTISRWIPQVNKSHLKYIRWNIRYTIYTHTLYVQCTWHNGGYFGMPEDSATEESSSLESSSSNSCAALRSHCHHFAIIASRHHCHRFAIKHTILYI